MATSLESLLPSCPLSNHITSLHITSPHITSPHVTSPHIASHHLTSHHLLQTVSHTTRCAGAMNRATAATGMNEGSSRSHSVFTVTGNAPNQRINYSALKIRIRTQTPSLSLPASLSSFLPSSSFSLFLPTSPSLSLLLTLSP
jgi:hypothetical protein